MDITSFFFELQREFHKKGVSFCFLRRYYDFNTVSVDDDIDIAIYGARKKVKEAINALRSESSIIRVVRNSNGNSIVSVWIHDDRSIRQFYIHFHTSIHINQIKSTVFLNELFNVRELINDATTINGSPTINDNYYLVLLIFHCLFDKGCFSIKYRGDISKLLKVVDIDSVSRILSSSSIWISDSLFILLGEDKYDEVLERKKELVKPRISLKELSAYIVLVLLQSATKVKKMFNRDGVYYSFVGADGAGKSSIIREVNKRIYDCRHSMIYGGCQKISQPAKNIPKIKHHAVSQKEQVYPPPLRSRAREVLHALLYVKRYLKSSFFLLRKEYILIEDRNYIDIFTINGGKPSSFTGRLALRLIPKPDCFIFLFNDPQIIISRKNELTVDEIKRIQEVFFLMEKRFSFLQIHSIMNDCAETVVDEIVDMLWETLMKNNKNGV